MNTYMPFRLLLLVCSIPSLLFSKEWFVGPSRAYTTPAAVSALVAAGDTISIDAAVYVNHPQVYFGQNNLLLRGIGGRPRLQAGAALAGNSNGKAIFVIGGSNCRVENIEFANAAVPDHNGAGIRQEGCGLIVRYCFFNGNEMGILGGNYTNCTVTLEHNVFLNNGSPANPGYQHNVYINKIDTLIFRYNYSVNAIAEGHELKSRARNNIILYNYIGNLSTTDSRTIDLPNGGTAVLVGNIIEQGPNSANSNLFGYGMEGNSNPGPHNVWVAHNTFVNKKATGNFIQVGAGTDTLFVHNNILVGPKTSGLIQGAPALLDSAHNLVHDNISVAGFQNVAAYDYRLQSGSPAIDQGLPFSAQVGSYALNPVWQYADTAQYAPRPAIGLPDIGAYEYAPVSAIVSSLVTASALYPNPCREVLFVRDLPSGTPYQIWDAQGRYAQGGLVQESRIGMEQLPSGWYWVRVGEWSWGVFKS